MKKPILLIVVIIIVIIVTGTGFYLFKNNKLPGFKSEETKNILEKNDFSINLPEGWTEVNALIGASATAIDSNETITDSAAQRINFRSYLSIVYDNLGSRTKEQYYQELEDALKEAFPGINFTREEKGIVDNKDTYFLEAEFTQKEADFYVMLAINTGEKDIWVISFNTLKTSWDNYKDGFYQTAESFKTK